ncbi:cell division protein CrgA [Streptomyces sp. NPDC008343]|uniref:cell division protein CrgA n=1 Tax=Streptomyces sp. NPDC008343 TaxID=3364828 RepID=UPI0036EF379C
MRQQRLLKPTRKKETSPRTRLMRLHWAPASVALLFLSGITWIVLFHVTEGSLPVQRWGNWNLGIGMLLLLGGMGISSKWT